MFVIFVAWLAGTAFAIRNDRLQALSLLGSHFGAVDIPATYD
jgi:uncharacterized membrane protein YqiK